MGPALCVHATQSQGAGCWRGGGVRVMRQCGCTVTSLAQLGGGVADLLVGRQGVNYVLEVKDGAKAPSKRKLTPDEAQWHAQWRGRADVVCSVDEALRAVGLGA